MNKVTNVLVLGAAGLLGHAVLQLLSLRGMQVLGVVRGESARLRLPVALQPIIQVAGDLGDEHTLARLFNTTSPHIVINCVGVVKQSQAAADPLTVLPVNALLPHRLANLCEDIGARLVHISTDCVFSGEKGLYREADLADARDLYGLSKYLGEVGAPHVTLRTSLIGPELGSSHGLLEWFLAQSGPVRGFTRALFSGLPTAELARVIGDVVLPEPRLCGVYHVAACPISKYDLLRLVAHVYDKAIEIVPDDTLVIDRSLDGSRFQEQTGYVAPSWPQLVQQMKTFELLSVPGQSI